MKLATRRILPLGLFLACLVLAAPARADEKVYQKLLPSAAYVEVKMSNGQMSIGSGVLVDAQRKWLVTSYHIVRDQDDVMVTFPASDNGLPVAAKLHYAKHFDKLFHRGKVVYRDERTDLAVVALRDLPPHVKAVPLATASASPGQLIHLIGNPVTEPAFWLYNYGKVRQVCQKVLSSNGPGGFKVTINCQAVLSTMPVNPGDSGGPVVNDSGALVGLVHGYIPASNDMGVIIDISEIRAVLAQTEKLIAAR